MSGFLYFRPQQTRNVTPEDVTAWGLAYAFEAPPLSRVCHNNTPTGQAGVVFAEESRQEAGCVKMDMDGQEWELMVRPGQSDIYIGYWKDALPTAADLVRSNLIGGFRLRMRDGMEWLCPLVVSFDGTSESLGTPLPARFELNENGEPRAGAVVAEYAYLYELMSEHAGHMTAGTLEKFFDDMPMPKLCRDAAQLLQTNYVVGLSEIEALNLWQIRGDDCREASTIVLSAIDYGTYSTWEQSTQKKTPSLAAVAG